MFLKNLSLLLVGGIAAIGLSQQASAQESTAAVVPPRISVSETRFEFGRVPQGALVSHVFWMKNTGGDTLRITEVKPGCGCVRAPLEKNALVDGDSTKVELIFSTGHYLSKVAKSARIMSNATGEVPRLALGADVNKDMNSVDVFTVEPKTLDLNSNRPEQQKHEWEYEFAIKNISDVDLSFTLVSPPDELMEIDFPNSRSIAPGKEMIFRVRFDKSIARVLFAKSLTIEASDEAKTRTTVPLTKSRRWKLGTTPED